MTAGPSFAYAQSIIPFSPPLRFLLLLPHLTHLHPLVATHPAPSDHHLSSTSAMLSARPMQPLVLTVPATTPHLTSPHPPSSARASPSLAPVPAIALQSPSPANTPLPTPTPHIEEIESPASSSTPQRKEQVRISLALASADRSSHSLYYPIFSRTLSTPEHCRPLTYASAVHTGSSTVETPFQELPLCIPHATLPLACPESL